MSGKSLAMPRHSWTQQRAHGQRRRQRKDVVPQAALAVALLGVLGSSWVFSMPRWERSDLRKLLLPASAGLTGMVSESAIAEQPKQGQEVTLRLGDSFFVRYPGSIPSDDLMISPGGDPLGDSGTQLLTNPKVIYVKKGGIAYGQGLRVGDELVSAQKEGLNVLYAEGQLRRMSDVDGEMKKMANSSEILGVPEGSSGAILEFRVKGAVQPGEPAPDFKLPASSGGELSLKELLEGNEYLVLFFRPSSRFRGGGLEEIKYFNRAQKALAEQGATVVGVQREPLGALKQQADGLGLGFPLLCDVNFEVAKAYGAYIELEGQGPNTDRKTFIIGKDGLVKTAFVAVGYDANKFQLQNHVADVVRVLGGDPKRAKADIQPKSKTVGDLLDVVTGKKAPDFRR